MARKIMILALVFFGMVCMASAIDGPAALKDAANAPIAVENNDVIGMVELWSSHLNILRTFLITYVMFQHGPSPELAFLFMGQTHGNGLKLQNEHIFNY